MIIKVNPAFVAGKLDAAGSIYMKVVGPRGRTSRAAHIVTYTDRGPLSAGDGWKKKNKKAHMWSALKAIALAEQVRPYLITERKQIAADIILEVPGITENRVKETDKLAVRITRANATRTCRSVKFPKGYSEDDIQYLAGVMSFRGRIEAGNFRLTTPDAEIPHYLRAKFGGKVSRLGVQRGSGFQSWAWTREVESTPWVTRLLEIMDDGYKKEKLLETLERKAQAEPEAPDPARIPHPADNDYRRLRRRGKASREDAMRETGVTRERAEWIDFANGYGSL